VHRRSRASELNGLQFVANGHEIPPANSTGPGPKIGVSMRLFCFLASLPATERTKRRRFHSTAGRGHGWHPVRPESTFRTVAGSSALAGRYRPVFGRDAARLNPLDHFGFAFRPSQRTRRHKHSEALFRPAPARQNQRGIRRLLNQVVGALV
jgi:hypothetical protein